MFATEPADERLFAHAAVVIPEGQVEPGEVSTVGVLDDDLAVIPGQPGAGGCRVAAARRNGGYGVNLAEDSASSQMAEPLRSRLSVCEVGPGEPVGPTSQNLQRPHVARPSPNLCELDAGSAKSTTRTARTAASKTATAAKS